MKWKMGQVIQVPMALQVGSFGSKRVVAQEQLRKRIQQMALFGSLQGSHALTLFERHVLRVTIEKFGVFLGNGVKTMTRIL